jgi:hypothetical protein
MADEARLNTSLFIRVNNKEYQSRPAAFNADVSTFKGATPGAIDVAQSGTDVDLSELTTPGLCHISNITDSDTIWLEYGIYDPEGERFYPLGELLPEEGFPFRLARYLQEEFGTGTGTGTAGANTNRLRIKAHGGPGIARVDAFEK